MSNFFANFPLIGYNFGNETNPALFQDISAYIKIIDDLRDDIAFYTTVHIQDYDRPDNFSYKLYGTTEFYWTFYYLNDDLRESGWPLPQQDLLPKAKVDYPHRAVTTTGNISKTFLPGHTVTGAISGTTGTVIKRYLDLGQIIIEPFSIVESITLDKAGSGYLTAPTVTITTISDDGGSGAAGVAQFSNGVITSIQVIPPVFDANVRALAIEQGKTDAEADIASLTSGFIGASKGDFYRVAPRVTISAPDVAGGVQAIATAVIATDTNFVADENITPAINGVTQTADFVIVKSEVEQYNSVHHYENASKEYVDIGLVPTGTGTGAFPSLSLKTPITYFDRILAKNDSLREINCLKPDVAVQIKSEFNKLLLEE